MLKLFTFFQKNNDMRFHSIRLELKEPTYFLVMKASLLTIENFARVEIH